MAHKNQPNHHSMTPLFDGRGGPPSDHDNCDDSLRQRQRHHCRRRRRRRRRDEEGYCEKSRSRHSHSSRKDLKMRIIVDDCNERHRRGRSSSSHSTSSSSSVYSRPRRRSKSRRRGKRRKRDDERCRNRARSKKGITSSRRSHRRRSYNDDDDSSSSSSLSTSSTERQKLRKRQHRNYTDERNSIIDKHIRIERDKLESIAAAASDAITKEDYNNLPFSNNGIAVFNNGDPPPPQPDAKVRGPMTQCEYSKLQSQIREVIDPHTGRLRYVRGTGEIIERIVSREEHLRLNRNATAGDGSGFVRDSMRAAAGK